MLTLTRRFGRPRLGWQGLLALVVALALSLLGGCTYTSGNTMIVEPDHAAAPMSADFFGMHIHRVGVDDQYWPSVGAPAVRLWDTNTTWRDLQPTPTTWDWSRLDANVGRAQRNHASILLTLGETPAWASARPTEASYYGSGASAEPRNLNDYANYVRAVVTRYQGRISAYEVWNEPIYPGYYSGSPQTMGALTRIAHDVIKSVDPSALVVSPAVLPTATSPAWLDAYLRTGAANYFDIAAVHLYQPTPELLMSSYEPIRAVFNRYGVNKPLWDTETGYRPPGGVPASQQRGFVARTYLLAAAGGFSRLYWYAWDNTTWVTLPMIQSDGSTPGLAGYAYRDTYRWLTGVTVQSCNGADKGSGLWQCTVRRGTRSSLIMWNATRIGYVPAPRGTVQLRLLDGRTGAIHSGTPVSIGPEPVEFVLG